MAIKLIEGFNGYYDVAQYVAHTGTVITVSPDGGSESLTVVSGVRGLNITTRGGYASAWRAHTRPIPPIVNFSTGVTITNSVQADTNYIIRDEGGTNYLGIKNSGGYIALRKLVSGVGADVLSSWPAAHTTPRYYEIVVSGATATLFINGYTAVTTTVTAGITYTKIYFESYGNTQTQRFSNVYVLDDQEPGPTSRLGPIKILPALPTSDAEVTQFTGTYTSIDENPTDLVSNNNYISANYNGARYTAHVTAPFASDMLAYRVFTNAYTQIATLFNFKTLIKADGSELEGDSTEVGTNLTYYTWTPQILAATLPDGSPLTVANLQSAEFGVSIIRNPDP